MNYTFTTTGHSLGAVLADLANAKLASQDFAVSSFNFDSPGSEPILRHYMENEGLNSELLDNLYIATYNVADNFINTMHQHVGDVYKIKLAEKSFFGKALEFVLGPVVNHHFGIMYEYGLKLDNIEVDKVGKPIACDELLFDTYQSIHYNQTPVSMEHFA